MKKINSNEYGVKVIGIGLIPLLLIPSGLYLINRILVSQIITVVMFISLGVGLVIEIAFGVLLLIEMKQDRKIDAYYQEHPGSCKTPQQILDGK